MAKNHRKYLNLRKKYPFFEYQSYSFLIKNQILEVEFIFNISGIYTFRPTIKIPEKGFYCWENLKQSELENLIFHIGMVELISYWKTTCSPIVIVRPHQLDEEQAGWWKKLYYHGLGEFFYLNGIETTFEEFMKIQSGSDKLKPVNRNLENQNIIVPVGGGKDSVVTLEILKESDLNIIPMSLNPRDAIKRTIASAGFDFDTSVVVERKLDPLLFELNEKGYLNGHTPFSALLAFVNLLIAVGTGTSQIALSNESSASQSTIPGTQINHQYSKSIEFEEGFRWYVKKYIHSEVEYFSFLRPLNELQIAKLFAGFPKHFKGFRSCNAGSKTDEWCGNCPKCLFTDIILSPFLSESERFDIFQKKLLDDSSLEPIFDELTGIADVKPFECVGTPDEVRSALYALSNRLDKLSYPYLLIKFVDLYKPGDWQENYNLLLNQFNNNHFIPQKLTALLQEKTRFSAVDFKTFLMNKFASHQKILILGFGREGRSTYSLLRDYFPEIQIGIADRNEEIGIIDELTEDQNAQIYTGEDYLNVLDEYDLVIKSPGIKLDQQSTGSHITFTSQTALFLMYYRDQVVGVTGTKGKSTTVSLIYHFLKNAGTKSVLLGNIGTPAFNHISKIDNETIVVFELSAHQLQNIEISPHIAVLLNIFPEHLDHFDSFEKYEAAKLNIGKYQKYGDKLIVSERITGKIKPFPSDSITINEEAFNGTLSVHENNELKGKHNWFNTEAALAVMEVLGVNRENSIQSLKHFNMLPHRLEYVGEYEEIKFYNDSISTIPESTIAAVKTIPDVDTLILGGFDRGLDYSDMVNFIKQSPIKNLIFLGAAGDNMLALFRVNQNPDQQLFKVNSLNDAFEIIKKETSKGKCCLLSPAAASYDQFHNFEHRGDIFKSLARLV